MPVRVPMRGPSTAAGDHPHHALRVETVAHRDSAKACLVDHRIEERQGMTIVLSRRAAFWDVRVSGELIGATECGDSEIRPSNRILRPEKVRSKIAKYPRSRQEFIRHQLVESHKAFGSVCGVVVPQYGERRCGRCLICVGPFEKLLSRSPVHDVIVLVLASATKRLV
jgi:hypothetical protein